MNAIPLSMSFLSVGDGLDSFIHLNLMFHSSEVDRIIAEARLIPVGSKSSNCGHIFCFSD